ncbi:hypothetical protein G6F68_016732 [Rhizopus microsporus]|nr:hypothetical protein G6F68_016732 [Rhizopus microsporus]
MGREIIDSIICVAVITTLFSFGIAHFHAQVAARHHHAVAGADQGVQSFVIGHRLGALDLRDDPRLAAGFGQQGARFVDVAAIARERHGHIVQFHFGRELDVNAVLVGQAGRGQAAAAAVDALVVRQRSAHGHGRVDLIAFDASVTSSG